MSTIPAGTYVIDPSHTEIGFSVRHAGISKVRGKFLGFSGTITVGENLADSSVNVTIEAASVDTGDANRDGHLRSPDFWDAENKPEWTFVSRAVSGTEEDLTVTGDLTINGVTRQVELQAEFNGAATDPFGNERIGFSGQTVINRKDFDLTWNAALETGGVLVGEKVTITLEVEATADAGEAAESAEAETNA
ncbi:YceI family protein [Georgenia deserti]|uniref:YceI family protein n=1 Tax=Georgenia deserti TaxID=2093781 RepID=A0ABW4L1L6_9MICO